MKAHLHIGSVALNKQFAAQKLFDNDIRKCECSRIRSFTLSLGEGRGEAIRAYVVSL